MTLPVIKDYFILSTLSNVHVGVAHSDIHVIEET